MTLIEATKVCFKKYTDFSGRASRSEFWKFFLFQFLATMALVLVNSLLFGPSEDLVLKFTIGSNGQPLQSLQRNIQYNAGWLGTAFSLAVLLPSLAVSWRRMHDIGRAGWHILMPIPIGISVAIAIVYFNSTVVPIDTSAYPEGLQVPVSMRIPGSVGVFFLGWLFGMAPIVLTIFWLAKKSRPGPNTYGPNPLAVTP